MLLDTLALTVFDAAHSEFEERWFTLGMSSEGKLLAVSHTYQHTGQINVRVRIISARAGHAGRAGQCQGCRFFCAGQ